MCLALKRWLAAVLLAAAAVIVWGFLGSKYALEVTSYAITTPKLTEAIRIVQLTDLHNGEFGEDNTRLVRLVQKQHPDLILMTGDMLNGDEMRTDVVQRLIEQLAEVAPVYASRGNHEKAIGKLYGIDVHALYREAGAVLLELDHAEITVNDQQIRLGGVFGYCLAEEYLKSGEAKWAEVEFLKDFQDTELFTILLCHYPLCWIVNDNLEQWDIDCVFAGHTHGGQVRLPFVGGVYAPDEGYFPGPCSGLYYSQDRERVMVLSRGLGSRGKIPRFNNVPEIVVVDILPRME